MNNLIQRITNKANIQANLSLLNDIEDDTPIKNDGTVIERALSRLPDSKPNLISNR